MLGPGNGKMVGLGLVLIRVDCTPSGSQNQEIETGYTYDPHLPDSVGFCDGKIDPAKAAKSLGEKGSA